MTHLQPARHRLSLTTETATFLHNNWMDVKRSPFFPMLIMSLYMITERIGYQLSAYAKVQDKVML